MQPSSLPSKKFIIRGSIAIVLVALVLICQSMWFKNLFVKKAKPLSPTTTVGEVVGQDSNKNGIPDWQEKLWGLDPTKLYTNGVPNAQIISQKQAALGITTTPDSGNLNSTDKLARDLFALTNGLSENGSIDDNAVQAVASELGKEIDIQHIRNVYSLSDITETKTTYASLSAYQNTLTSKLEKYQEDQPNIEIVINALQNGDYSQLPELADAATQYAAVAKDLKNMKVPIGVEAYHLDIMNGFAGMAQSFLYLKELDTNGVDALSGISLYRNYSTSFSSAVTSLAQYLQRYGILSS